MELEIRDAVERDRRKRDALEQAAELAITHSFEDEAAAAGRTEPAAEADEALDEAPPDSSVE